MIRYCVLTQAMVFRDIAASVRKRFPTMHHLVTAGLMTEAEMKEFDSIESRHVKYWQPMHWLFSLVRRAREETFITGEVIYVDLMEKLRQFRVDVLSLTLYDWVPVPLVYTQVVHLAVRSYFMVALMGRQYIHPTRDVDGFTKTNFRFTFYVGWMKVAEVLLNPFGDDKCFSLFLKINRLFLNDDDFEVNWLIDRNLQVGLLVVDTAYGHYPELAKDPFWQDKDPIPLYTTESAMRPMNPQVGSCVQLTTDEEPFMLNPRRRTVKRTEEWDGEVDENDIVPVLGLSQKRREGGSNASGESLAFSQSFMSQSRRLSDMFKRIRGRKTSEPKGLSGFDMSRRSRIHRMSESITPTPFETGGDMNSGLTSRQNSNLSVNQFGESITLELPPHSPNFNYNSGRVLYTPDGIKTKETTSDEKENEDFPCSPRPSHTPLNSWYVDEMLPSIQEEDTEKKRQSASDGDSFRSHTSTLNSRNASELTRKLPKRDSKDSVKKITSDENDDSRKNSVRRKRSTHTQRELDEQEREPTDSEADEPKASRSRKSSVRSMNHDRSSEQTLSRKNSTNSTIFSLAEDPGMVVDKELADE
ncbi:hypothetical protein WR25_06956 [Diploscapter pachys]|uniref:Bestrophin homolog n=1 Tax=Diploscapter pachys TaxID=2018661 RepID=A0A2A2KY65_9BILA|nr:hypothetical protein WR25_06956 [Diploscapter pachys]